MESELKPLLFKLLEHNSDEQMNYSGHDDTRKHLTVGKIYAGIKEVHAWHTEIWIGDHEFNSVCFEEVDTRPAPSKQALPDEDVQKILDNAPPAQLIISKQALDEKQMYNFLMNKFAEAREKNLTNVYIHGDSADYVAKAICQNFSGTRVPTKELITQAVARGWCHPKNENKEMDADLVFAISDEIHKLLTEGN